MEIEQPLNSDEALMKAAVATVAFYDVFDYPLTVEEISYRMIGAWATADRLRAVLGGVARDADGVGGVRPVCSLSVANPPLVSCDGLYVLPGREELVARRAAGQVHHDRLLTHVRRAARLFHFVPFLRGVFLCNRLAMAQADAASDIDVLVVVRRGHLFFVRAVLLGIFHILGLRRHGARIAGRFCFSFMIDDAHLDMSAHARENDVYFASWILLLRPIYGVQYGSRDLLRDVLRENSWIHSLFPHPENRQSCTFAPVNDRPADYLAVALHIVTTPIRYLFAIIGYVAEPCMRAWQLRRARAKYEVLGRPHGVVIKPWCLKFHDRDMRDAYRDAWRERLGSP